MADDLFGVDGQPPEDGQRHQPAFGIWQLGVQLVGVGQQLQCFSEDLAADVEAGGGVGLLLIERAAFLAKGSQLGLELVLRPVRITEQVEVAVFLGVEFGQPFGEPVLQLGTGGLVVAQGGVDLAADGGSEGVIESNAVVALGEFAFEGFSGHVGLVTADFGADTVEVFVTLLGLNEQHAVAAAGAPENTFEVVLQLALPDAGTAVGIEDALDAVEQFHRDEGFVTAGVPVAFVFGFADVEAVAQDEADGAAVGGVFGSFRRCPYRQATGHDDVGGGFEGVFVGGVQLEQLTHQRCPVAFVVDGDGANFAAFGAVPNVLVANGSHTEGTAAGHDFLAHLVLDVGTGGIGLVLVEDGDHAVHGFAGWGAVEVAFGG